MKHYLLFLLFVLTLLGCGEGRVDFITSDVISEAASCYQSVEVVDDSYLVALDKTCIDLELSGFGGVSPAVPQETVIVEQDWELLATLERDVRQKLWHVFHVQKGTDQPLLRAYIDGKDFLFVIENSRDNEFWHSVSPIQFYFHQPEPPNKRAVLYYPSKQGWYEHWGGKTTVVGFPIDRSASGLYVKFDIGFAGSNFKNPDNREKQWVGGTVEFRTTRDGLFASSTHAPHIKDGFVLKIYVR